jgi:hypothetical protein
MAEAAKPKKLLSILHCSRPVLFQNADPGFPFSIGGTAFIVRFRKRHFVITAKHVLTMNGFQPEQFRIQYRADSKAFLPLKSVYWLRRSDEDDTDQFDLAAWDVDENAINVDLFCDDLPYELRQSDNLTVFGANSHYLYRGFPTFMRSVDYGGSTIKQGSISSRAQYRGPTPYTHIHEIVLVNDGTLASVDGLSGSPIFQVNSDVGQFSYEAFAGIMIRGNPNKVYFLVHRRVIEMLVDVCEARTVSVGSPSVTSTTGMRGRT